jgi:hypothetical protein
MKKRTYYVYDKYVFWDNPSYTDVQKKMEELKSQGWRNLEFQEKGETNCSDPRSDFSWPNQIKGDRPLTDQERKTILKEEQREEKNEKEEDLKLARKVAKKWKHKVVAI